MLLGPNTIVIHRAAGHFKSPSPPFPPLTFENTMTRFVSIALAIGWVLVSSNGNLNAELVNFAAGFVNGQLSNTLAAGSTNVTFAFTDSNSVLNGGQPEISSGSGLNNSLAFSMNSPNTSDYISLLVSFDAIVSGASFTLGDIDHANRSWQDIVVITGLLNGVEVGSVITSNLGSVVGRDTNGNDYLTNHNATLFGIANNSEIDGEANGNVDVMFSQIIDSFRIDYRPGRNDDGLPDFGPHNPSSQFIRLGGLGFARVPEPGSLLLFGAALLPVAIRRRSR